MMPSLLIVTSVATANDVSNAQFGGTTFGDWLVHCTPIEANVDAQSGLECSMSQQIEFEDNSEPLLRTNLYLNPANGNPEVVFVLPLGIPLSNGPILSFNNSKGSALKVSHCHRDGCYFKTPLDATLLETFLSMQSGQIELSGNDNETIQIPISGNGSRAAYSYFKTLPKN